MNKLIRIGVPIFDLHKKFLHNANSLRNGINDLITDVSEDFHRPVQAGPRTLLAGSITSQANKDLEKGSLIVEPRDFYNLKTFSATV